MYLADDIVSELCMYKYESSVALARSLRSHFDQKEDYSENDDLCDSSGVQYRSDRSDKYEKSGLEVTTLVVAPNPAEDQIQVTRNKTDAEERFEVYNTQGVIVDQFSMPGEVSSHQINIDHLPSGMYWIKSAGQDKLQYATFIKQ